MIAAVKALHIAGLVAWCAALIALPLLLHLHGHARRQRQFIAFRLITHVGYTAIATPAAVVAVAAGTALIFLARVYEPWLLAKLALVAAMVLVHVWLGHLIGRSGEVGRPVLRPPPILALVLTLPLIAAVLMLVLAKPDLRPLEGWLPAWAQEPRARDLRGLQGGGV